MTWSGTTKHQSMDLFPLMSIFKNDAHVFSASFVSDAVAIHSRLCTVYTARVVACSGAFYSQRVR